MSAAYAKTTFPDEMFSSAREKMETMVAELQSPKMLAAEHSELEAFVQTEGRELQRLLYEANLDLRAARERPVPVRGSDGVERTYRRPSRRPANRRPTGRPARPRSRLGRRWRLSRGAACPGSAGPAE